MITSTQNPKIKNIIKLRKSGERKKQDSIVIEGEKEIELAKASGLKLVEFFYCSDFGASQPEDPHEETSRSVFEKMSYRDKPDGYLALARPEYLTIEDVKLTKKPLIVVLESLEKPGNLGAILRTCDAVGVDAVIINDHKTDIFNPNVIRASRGTVFTNQIVVASRQETITWLMQKSIKSFATSLKAKNDYSEVNYSGACAIIFGTEHEGLSGEWEKSADELIKIPMRGKIDSLNVSVSAGVILYEILRQKGSGTPWRAV